MINKAEQDLVSSLTDRIAALERDLRELKAAPQPIAASSLTMELVGPGEISDTVPASKWGGGGTRFSNSNQASTLWDWMFDIYIDGHDTAHKYLDSGASLTAGQQNFFFSWHVQGSASMTGDNSRYLIVQIRNEDSSSHTYYIDVYAVTPKMLGTTTPS